MHHLLLKTYLKTPWMYKTFFVGKFSHSHSVINLFFWVLLLWTFEFSCVNYNSYKDFQ